MMTLRVGAQRHRLRGGGEFTTAVLGTPGAEVLPVGGVGDSAAALRAGTMCHQRVVGIALRGVVLGLAEQGVEVGGRHSTS